MMAAPRWSSFTLPESRHRKEGCRQRAVGIGFLIFFQRERDRERETAQQDVMETMVAVRQPGE